MEIYRPPKPQRNQQERFSITTVPWCVVDIGYSPCSGIIGILRWIPYVRVLLHHIPAGLDVNIGSSLHTNSSSSLVDALLTGVGNNTEWRFANKSLITMCDVVSVCCQFSMIHAI